MKKLISRKEAASILQVHPQTVSNYSKNGMLKEVRKGKLCYYYEEQVRSLVGPSAEFVTLEQEIQAHKDELEKIKQEYNSLKQLWHKKLHSANSAIRIYDLIMVILMKFVDQDNEEYPSYLSTNERTVVKGFLDLKSTEELSKELGLTVSRINQIFNISLKKLMRYGSAITERDILLESNKSLEQQISILKYELNEWNELKISSGISEDEIRSKISKKITLCDKHPILNKKISDINISTRCRKCLESIGIYTMLDLVKSSRSDLHKIRNLGKKSITELDLLLKKYKLKFGMLDS